MPHDTRKYIQLVPLVVALTSCGVSGAPSDNSCDGGQCFEPGTGFDQGWGSSDSGDEAQLSDASMQDAPNDAGGSGGTAGSGGSGGTAGSGGSGGSGGTAGSGGSGGTAGSGGSGGTAGSGGSGGTAGSGGSGGSTVTMCDKYPSTNGLINKGNPIRNYAYIDKNGKSHHICELSNGTNRFAYFVYSSLHCGYCQEETQYFDQFQKNNAANNLVVVEAVVDATSANQLQAWPGSKYHYNLISVKPNPNQPQADCMGTSQCDSGYVPHHMLIDLKTMKVLEPNCTTVAAIQAHDRSKWQECVNKHL